MTQVIDQQPSDFNDFEDFDDIRCHTTLDNICMSCGKPNPDKLKLHKCLYCGHPLPKHILCWNELKMPIEADIHSPNKIPFLEIYYKDPEWNICPIGKDIITYPCRTYEKGHHFEEKDLKEWIQEEGTCPLTRKPMTIADILPASKQYLNMLQTNQKPDELIKYSITINGLHFNFNDEKLVFFNNETDEPINLNLELITSWRLTKYGSGKIATLQINFQHQGHTKYICLSNSTINIELDKIFKHLIPNTKTFHHTTPSLLSSLTSNEITSSATKKTYDESYQFDI
tara:strand:- start:350 stop:1204 length:855 start_codon:yes stop_codon:yes gene_type:complete